MSDRVYVSLSMPENFKDKFFGMIHNINAVNNDKEVPIEIEQYYKKKKYAATPKKNEDKPLWI